ncbi:MAG: DUF1705 domain-containing protein, partial [Neisseriaceae bacterium]|nr:DUF1705 domain-containing protein [Neisseriaceae bacterium]
MNHIKSLSQPSLSLLLALYIGFVLNLSVLHTRFDTLFTGPFSAIEWVGALAESAAVVLLTYFLLTLLSLSGRMGYRLLSALLLLVSVAASYYMTFFNVVIGYGVVISVLTTDTDLSKEVVGRYFILWLVLLSAFPLWLIWRSPLQRTLWAQLNTPSQRWRALRHLAWVLVAIGLPLHFLDRQQEAQAVTENVDLPSYGGVVAHSYLPSNWLSALGLYGWTQYEEYTDQRQLFDPAEHFTYAGTA